jgi:serine/threonine protein kinase
MTELKTGLRVAHGDDRYVIGEMLGSGGFGAVYKAELTNPTLTAPMPVVVKVPHPSVLSNPELLQKFSREARILANISHPHVVRIIAFWEFEDGDKAIVQEEVNDARTLTQYVAARPDEAASLLLQALYGLSAFHMGSVPAIVHRDVTPHNLLVDSTGVLKVIDFGMAKEDPRQTLTLTRVGMMMGTVGCIAPEQTKDAAHVDHRADLYGLGKSFAAAMQDREPQHVDCHKLPEPWRCICMTLTEHSPEDRYQDAAFALSQAMLLFAQHWVPVANFRLHVKQMRKKGAVDGWPHLCAGHFGNLQIGEAELTLLNRLDEPVLAAGAFGLQDFFEHVEVSPAIDDISRGITSFESADPLGSFYGKVYPHLQPEQKERCLRRMVRTAISQHRYSVMGDVRDVFSGEGDEATKIRLVGVLDEEDAEREIYGKGVIPTR